MRSRRPHCQQLHRRSGPSISLASSPAWPSFTRKASSRMPCSRRPWRGSSRCRPPPLPRLPLQLLPLHLPLHHLPPLNLHRHQLSHHQVLTCWIFQKTMATTTACKTRQHPAPAPPPPTQQQPQPQGSQPQPEPRVISWAEMQASLNSDGSDVDDPPPPPPLLQRPTQPLLYRYSTCPRPSTSTRY